MLSKLMWFPIGKKLVNFLSEFRYEDGKPLFHYLTDREDLKIKLGSGNFGEYPAIWVLFGSETEVNKQDSIVGAITEFWIDLYVKTEATPDEEQDIILYRQLFNMEQELDNVLRIFNVKIQEDYKVGTNMKIKDILSDGDVNSPATAQHRIILDIEWYKSGRRPKN